MIRKVYEVDPLCCPSCGGQMRVISFIKEPKVIDGIIASLKLSFKAELPCLDIFTFVVYIYNVVKKYHMEMIK